jgi:hypothetical protein
MNYNQHFDEHIKDQFADYTPSVHPRIWDNIMAEREKKKPVGFWWRFFNQRNLVLLGALLISAGAASYFLLSKNNAANVNTTSPVHTQQITTAETINSTQPGNIPAAGNGNNTTPGGSNTIATGNANTNTSFIVTNNNKGTVQTPPAVNEKTVANNNSLPPSSAKGVIRYNNAGKQKLTIKNGSAASGDDETGRDDYYLPFSLSAAEKSNSPKQSIATLSKRNTLNVTDPGCPVIERNAAGNKIYIEIYGGPDVAFRNLSDTGSSAYLQKRKESTKFSSAFSAGIRYTKVFNNGVSIRAGINYSQINEKFTFSEGNIVQVVYIINAAGDTIGSYTTTGSRYKTTHNKFRTIDVPVVLGYELGNGKWHANVNAGVMINIYSWQKGEVLDANLQPVNITTGKSNSPYQFKTNIGTAFIGDISLYYKINDKLHVMAEPYFRYSLTPASKETTTFKQKYNTTGLRLGVRLDLH